MHMYTYIYIYILTGMMNESLFLHLYPMDDCVVSGTVCLSELSQLWSNVGQVGPGFNLGETPAVGHFVLGLQTGSIIFVS